MGRRAGDYHQDSAVLVRQAGGPAAVREREGEVRAEHLLTEMLMAQGWDARKPPVGDLLRQQEYKDHPALAEMLKGLGKQGGGGDALPEGILVARSWASRHPAATRRERERVRERVREREREYDQLPPGSREMADSVRRSAPFGSRGLNFWGPGLYVPSRRLDDDEVLDAATAIARERAADEP